MKQVNDGMTNHGKKLQACLRRAVPWFPTIIALSALLFLTLQSPQGTTSVSGAIQQWLISFFSKFGDVPSWVKDGHMVRSLAHIPEYFILGCALYIGFYFSLRGTVKHPAIWTLITGAIIGLLDEGLKELLPTREFDLGDWGLDIIGLVIAVVICTLIAVLVRTVRKRRSSIIT